MKKIKMLLVVIVSLVAMAIPNAVRAQAETQGDYDYTVLDDGTVKITQYNGTADILRIPGTINNKQVTVLGDKAFDNSVFTELYIPNGIKSIGKETFRNCDNFKSVTIPGSVETIGEYAFEGCAALETVTISEGVTKICDYAFNFCSKLSSVSLPESMRRIGLKAFYNTAIVKSQTTQVKYVDKWAVQCDSGLTSVSVSGAVGIADKFCSTVKKTLEKVVIYDGVKYIGYFAFSGCESLTDVTLPIGLEYIYDGAFYECKGLEYIVLPNSLKEINGAFQYCTALTSIDIPEGVTEIGEVTFFRCYQLEKVTIPESVTSIGRRAFYDCTLLSSVTLPSQLETIDECAFANCAHLNSITIPKSVKNLTESYCPLGFYGSLDYSKYKNFKIYCYYGTSGEAYAKKEGFEYEVLDPHTHEYGNGKVTTAATCTTDGIRTYTCSSCGESCTETIKATGHSYTTKVVAPTYAAQGYTLHACSKCGSSYKDKYTKQLVLGNVSGLKMTANTSSTIKLQWGKVKGATGYVVYQQVNGKWVKKTVTSSNTYTAKGLKSGTNYKFTVRAYRTFNSKNYYSSYATSTNTIKACTKPATVRFKLSAGKKKATVKWSKVKGATGYMVYYKTSAKGSWKRLTTTKGTSYTKTGLTRGKTYYFMVKSYKTMAGVKYYSSFTTKSVKVK